MNNKQYPGEITYRLQCSLQRVQCESKETVALYFEVKWRQRRLTAIVQHQLLQAGELSAWGDVEASTVQLPDLVMLHIQAFGVVVVHHRQAIGPCKGGGGDKGPMNSSFSAIWLEDTAISIL